MCVTKGDIIMNKLYVWHNEDRSTRLYATIEQVKQYEKENNVKLHNGGQIVSVINTQTGEVFSV